MPIATPTAHSGTLALATLLCWILTAGIGAYMLRSLVAHGALRRQRPVQRERLLGMHESGRVEVTELPAPSPARNHDPEGGQHFGGDPGGVLGCELQLGQGVLCPGTDPERVQ